MNLEEDEPKLGKHGKPTISGAAIRAIVRYGRREEAEIEVIELRTVGM
jgi:hypothetical protein